MLTIDTQRLRRLPPYLFNELNRIKLHLRQEGTDVIDLGMANPDQPAPDHITSKLIQVVQDPKTHRYSEPKKVFQLSCKPSADFIKGASTSTSTGKQKPLLRSAVKKD